MTTPTTPDLGCMNLLGPWLLENPAPTDPALRYARAVRALADTLNARLNLPAAEIINRMFTQDHTNTPWVRKDGHYIATAVATTRQVLDTVVDAASLLEAGRTGPTWAVLDLGGEQLHRLLTITEAWEEESDFSHTAASTQSLLDLQKASHKRGIAFIVPIQHRDYLSEVHHSEPTESEDRIPLPIPTNAAAILAVLRAGDTAARAAIPFDATTRPDLAPTQHTTADTTAAQQYLQATLAIDLISMATTALCKFIGNFIDSHWATWLPEIRLATNTTTTALQPTD
jgi:hypothetical protein